MKQAVANSFTAGAKYWTCACGQGNAASLAICGGCGQSRTASGMIDKMVTQIMSDPKRKGNRRLRKHREPNQTERDFGLRLEAMKLRGEIEYYGFEEITLRWADLEYTPDYFVIREIKPVLPRLGGPGRHGDEIITAATVVADMRPQVAHTIEAVYIELKGAHKWEDSVVKFKTARERFSWAEFQMWQRIGRGQDFERIG